MKFAFFGARQARDTMGQILVLFLIALAFVAFIAGVIGYKIGHRQGAHQAAVVAINDDGKTLTTDDIKAIRLESEINKTELSTLMQERDISLNNLNLLREEMQALKQNQESLEKLNDVLMRAAVQEGGLPLKVLSSQILALPDNAYEYHFEVAMLSEDGQGKTLIPELTLLNSTSMVPIPLSPKSYDLNGIAKIEGRFIMPEEFSPSQMKLKLSVDGKNLEELYDWRVKNAQ